MSKATVTSFVDSMSLAENDASTTSKFYDDTIQDFSLLDLFTNVRLISTPLSTTGVTGDIVDEDFTPDPFWTATGDSSVVSNQLKSVAATTNAFSAVAPTPGQAEELWAECDFIYDSSSTPQAGVASSIFWFNDISLGDVLRVEILDDGSNLIFRWLYIDDAGAVAGNSLIVVQSDTTYKITLHYLRATTTSSNDGIFQIWINQNNILDKLDADNNGRITDLIHVGVSELGTGTITSFHDNVKVGTIGIDPRIKQISLDTYTIPDDVVKIQEMFYDSSVIPPSTPKFLNALNQEWRDQKGRPIAYVLEEETTKQFRLYKTPDINSKDFIFLFGEPLGRDFPEYSVGIVHTEIRKDNPAWLDYVIGLKVLSREHQKDSAIVDTQYATITNQLADILLGAISA